MPFTMGKCKLFRIKHITLLEGKIFLRNKHEIVFFEIKCTFFLLKRKHHKIYFHFAHLTWKQFLTITMNISYSLCRFRICSYIVVLLHIKPFHCFSVLSFRFIYFWNHFTCHLQNNWNLLNLFTNNEQKLKSSKRNKDRERESVQIRSDHDNN